MDHKEVGQYWNQNAPTWTRLARMGCDVYRDYLNTPAFLAMLPDVSGLHGLDIGCGEGHNTRLLAQRGAKMAAIDIAETFIAFAKQKEAEAPLGIDYRVASAVELPFPDASFDFATGFMSFMDIPEYDKVISEAHRVLRVGGFLQFSITHPCFFTPRFKHVSDETGTRVAYECGDYFKRMDGRIEEWIFGAAPPELKKSLPKFKVPRFTRTLSEWLNALIAAGFTIERLNEPYADDETARRCPDVADTQIVAYFLHLRCRK
ncbi:MAG: methyltransferase domain-containing protein [Planctomycetota bacterium]